MADQKSAAQFVASADEDNPTIIDGLGKHLIEVGVNVGAPGFVVGGAAVVEDVGTVVRIASVNDNEGHPPGVYVDWPGEGVEGYLCSVRDYRQEGPSGPYVYVCGDLVVITAGEQASASEVPEHVWIECVDGYLRVMPPGDWIDFPGTVHYVLAHEPGDADCGECSHVDDVEGPEQDQALADAKRDQDAAGAADAMREGLTPPSRPAGVDC